MRKSRRTGRRAMAEINVVPYIDVMLVLLVIFMITAPLLTQGVDVNLPQASTKQLIANNQIPVVVSVDQSGRYYVNVSPTPEVPVDAQTLVNEVAAQVQLAQQKSLTLPVYLKGDQDVDYGTVMQAMSLLQQAGAESIGLLTRDNQTMRNPNG